MVSISVQGGTDHRSVLDRTPVVVVRRGAQDFGQSEQRAGAFKAKYSDPLAPAERTVHAEAIRAAEAELGGPIWRSKELLHFVRTTFDAARANEAGPIFVPRAAVDGEARMGLTPAGIGLLRGLGVENAVYVEAGSGINRYTGEVYYSDDDYRAAGATVLAKEAFLREARASERKLVVSIKEPQPSEFELITGADLFTYLHLADLRELTEQLTQLVRSAVAYETITHRDEVSGLLKTPVLAPASHGAGWLSALRYGVATKYGKKSDANLDARFRELSASYPKVPRQLRKALEGKSVTVLGGGISGEASAIALARMGADVTITEVQANRIAELSAHFAKLRLDIRVLQRKDFRTPLPQSEDTAILRALERSNAIIGAILIPGAPAPKEISRDLYQRLAQGRLEFISDIAIDQGGNFELEKPAGRHYKYADGWPDRNGVGEFIVTNMPSAIPKQISHGLERAKLTYLVAMLMGLPTAIESFPELSGGLNVHQGQVTNQHVAKKHDLRFVSPELSTL